MKFTKHLIALSLGVVAASSLAGCGNKKANSSNSSSDVSSSSSAKDKTTVTFWNNYPVDTDGRGTANDSNYKAYWYMVDMIAEFEKNNPSIHIETKGYGSYASIADDVNKGLKEGKTPSMAITYGTYAYNWEKYLVDVTDKGLAMENDSDIISSYMDVEKQQYGGSKYYTLPFGKSTETLMTNHEVFAAVGSEAAGIEIEKGYPAPKAISTKKAYSHPDTFSEMMDLARQMKTDYPEIFATQKNSAGYFTACPLIYEESENLFFTVMESAGIPYVAAVDSAKDGVLFNNNKAKEAVCQLKKWNNEGLICVADNLYLTDEVKNSHAYPSDVFGAGKCFMVIATTRGSKWMAQDGYTVDYNKLPKWDANSTVKAISQGGSICFFQKSNKAEQEAALAFYDFLNKAENLAKLSVATDYCPIRSSSYEAEEIKANVEAAKTGVTASSSKDDKVKALAGQVLNLNAEYAKSNETFMSPVNKYSASMRSEIETLITNVFSETATTDEEIKTLVENEFTKAYQNSVK
jgi:hypothetical protein